MKPARPQEPVEPERPQEPVKHATTLDRAKPVRKLEPARPLEPLTYRRPLDLAKLNRLERDITEMEAHNRKSMFPLTGSELISLPLSHPVDVI